MASLPQMWRQNKNTDTSTHGLRGLSFVLPKVQIHLCDLLQEWKNGRKQNARRLDAVQTEKIGLYCAFLHDIVKWAAKNGAKEAFQKMKETEEAK